MRHRSCAAGGRVWGILRTEGRISKVQARTEWGGYHPAIIAQASATLSQLAPGRTFLGVGTGEALNEYPVTGEWPGYLDRQSALAESIGLIRDLWSGDEITHHGTYYETHRAKLFTPPAGDIPLYISSLVPESAAFAGRHGDGLISVGGKQPEVYQHLLEEFELGFTHLFFHSADPDQGGFLQRFGRDVLPKLRQIGAQPRLQKAA